MRRAKPAPFLGPTGLGSPEPTARDPESNDSLTQTKISARDIQSLDNNGMPGEPKACQMVADLVAKSSKSKRGIQPQLTDDLVKDPPIFTYSDSGSLIGPTDLQGHPLDSQSSWTWRTSTADTQVVDASFKFAADSSQNLAPHKNKNKKSSNSSSGYYRPFV